VPIPFNITLLKFGNETVLFDAGTGGQFQPTAGAMIANMAAAGIQPAQITKVIVSHFHPDHVFGLMSKAPDSTPVFPSATIYVPSNEFKFWMDSSIFTRLPEKQHGLPKRLQAMFPLLKDKVKQYEWDTEVIPGIHSIAAPGHTPGHTAFVVGSGKEQLMVLSDTTNMPALFAKHPDWHGAIDADPVLAEIVRPCRVRQGDRYRLPLPVTRCWYDRAGRRRLYLRACCIIKDDVYGNGHRLLTSVAVSTH
jgi:glyoxylase-like metal-dependent hydrolase (beta-lactamase superfamily II)